MHLEDHGLKQPRCNYILSFSQTKSPVQSSIYTAYSEGKCSLWVWYIGYVSGDVAGGGDGVHHDDDDNDKKGQWNRSIASLESSELSLIMRSSHHRIQDVYCQDV